MALSLPGPRQLLALGWLLRKGRAICGRPLWGLRSEEWWETSDKVRGHLAAAQDRNTDEPIRRTRNDNNGGMLFGGAFQWAGL